MTSNSLFFTILAILLFLAIKLFVFEAQVNDSFDDIENELDLHYKYHQQDRMNQFGG